MGRVFGVTPDLTYQARCVKLIEQGVALWDVCAAAERNGSLDAAIVATSVVPNDFAAFLATYKQIQRICFNGQTAAKLFCRHVLPILPPPLAALPRITLPSTSSAHAGMTAETKLAIWRDGLSR
jgi:hypoxanthine-DNA glycosylase